MSETAFILLDRNDNFVRCFSKPAIQNPYQFILEEDGLTYQAVTDINNDVGTRIATIYKEK